MLAVLRNGNPGVIVPVYLTSGLESAYHWVLASSVDNYGSAPRGAAAHVGVITHSHVMRCLTAVYAHQLRAKFTDVATHQIAARILATRRMMGQVCLGLLNMEITNSQTFTIPGTFSWSANGITMGDYALGGGGTLDDVEMKEDWNTWNDDSVTDRLFMRVARAAVGIYVTQGVMLVRSSGHHYINPYKAISHALLK